MNILEAAGLTISMSLMVHLFLKRSKTLMELDEDLKKYKSFYHDIQLPLALLEQDKELAYQYLSNFRKDKKTSHFYSLENLESKLSQFVSVRYPQVKVSFKIDQEHVYFKGDLFRSLFNLVNNSVEAGAFNIKMSTKLENSLIKLTIEDDGSGFSKEILSNLKKGNSTSKKNGLGVGLGQLRKTVFESHGDLFVEESQSGACISISLLNLKSFEIIQIEDDLLTQKLWKTKFESLGLKLKQFATVPKNLNITNQFSLMFVDMFIQDTRLTTQQLSWIKSKSKNVYVTSGLPDHEIDGLPNIGKFISFS